LAAWVLSKRAVKRSRIVQVDQKRMLPGVTDIDEDVLDCVFQVRQRWIVVARGNRTARIIGMFLIG